MLLHAVPRPLAQVSPKPPKPKPCAEHSFSRSQVWRRVRTEAHQMRGVLQRDGPTACRVGWPSYQYQRCVVPQCECDVLLRSGSVLSCVHFDTHLQHGPSPNAGPQLVQCQLVALRYSRQKHRGRISVCFQSEFCGELLCTPLPLSCLPAVLHFGSGQLSLSTAHLGPNTRLGRSARTRLRATLN